MSKKSKIEIDVTTWCVVVIGMGFLAIVALLSPLNEISQKEREIVDLRDQLDRSQR